MEKTIRSRITSLLNNIIETWPDEDWLTLDNDEKGFLMAHGECFAFAKEAVRRLDKENIVSAKDITVLKWRNEEKMALLHVILIIHGRIYDSALVDGSHSANRENLNTLFLRYAASSKLTWGDCGIIVEENTNKVLYNPWPREGIVLMPYTEMRINGTKFL